MSAVSVLAEGGIIGAEDVVSIAAIAGLELAAAATLLVKESSGGRNVWGHDAVTVAPNTYVKGGPVTQSNYTAYRAAVNAGHAGRQGCGPTQLTFGPFQQRADDARWLLALGDQLPGRVRNPCRPHPQTSGLRLRRILRRPDLGCESLPGCGPLAANNVDL